MVGAKSPSRFARSLVFLVGSVVFATVLFVDRDHYLRHSRWTDYRLTYSTPTDGTEFVRTGTGGLQLNPDMASGVESRLEPGEVVALRAEAAGPFWRKNEPQAWVNRVCAVTLEKDTHPFVVRLHLWLADADRAERIGRMVSDEVIQFGSRVQFDRERAAESRQLEEELRDNGGVMSPELLTKFRNANGGSWLSLQHVSRLNRFYPKASAGKVVVWPRFAESAAEALIGAAIAGVLAWWLGRLTWRRVSDLTRA